MFMIATGYGDVSYNSRRNLLAAMPWTQKTFFHLFNIQYNASTSNNYTVKLLKRSKWQSGLGSIKFLAIIYSLYKGLLSLIFPNCSLMIASIEGDICGFDLDPNGESAVVVNSHGLCMVTDINTGNALLPMGIDNKIGIFPLLYQICYHHPYSQI